MILFIDNSNNDGSYNDSDNINNDNNNDENNNNNYNNNNNNDSGYVSLLITMRIRGEQKNRKTDLIEKT